MAEIANPGRLEQTLNEMIDGRANRERDDSWQKIKPDGKTLKGLIAHDSSKEAPLQALMDGKAYDVFQDIRPNRR